MAPFVQLKLPGGEVIKVGNNSSPYDFNSATISSFQFGISAPSGYGAEFEVFDSGGAFYRKIIRAMNKTIATFDQEVKNCEFEFGWIIKKTDGTQKVISNITEKQTKIRGNVVQVETTFDGANVRMKFTVSGIMYRVADIRHDGVIGGDKNKVYLRDALTKLFTEYFPKFTSVRFLDKDGSEENFKFNMNGKDGPKSQWPMNQKHQLAIARDWLNGVTSYAGKGLLIKYDSSNGGIIIQEDENDQKCCMGRFLGTYIVNGGNCGNVIKFTPTVQWMLGLQAGSGATAGGANSGNNSSKVKSPDNVQKAGTQSSPAPSQNAVNYLPPDQVPEATTKAFQANLNANAYLENPMPGFSAELEVHGDPSLSYLPDLTGAFVSIVVLNPFTLQNDKWLTSSTCNSILSNKHYLVTAVNHQIQAGSFVTTLKVTLPQPNTGSIPAGAGLGFACGTETFVDAPGATSVFK